MNIFTVQLYEIPVASTDTDDILLVKAQDYLPQALKRLGETTGQELWATIERDLSNSSFKFTSSEKSKFIREAADEFAKNATAAERNNIVQTIFEQLQQQRAKV